MQSCNHVQNVHAQLYILGLHFFTFLLCTKQSKRTCIGKIDPVTGEMIPTGKRGRKKSTTDETSGNDEYAKLLSRYEDIKKENLALNEKVFSLEKELSDATKQIQKYRTTVKKIEDLVSKISL